MSIWTAIPAEVIPSPAIPVVSVGNMKGGVGKTTVVANLAIALVQQGMRVLAIDLDFQASLSVAFPQNVIRRRAASDGGLNVLVGAQYDMFHDGTVTDRGIPPFDNLSLVRTSFGLADLEDRLFASFILGREQKDPRFALLRKLLDHRLPNDFDIVIVDTPPRLTLASINALCASTHILIPTVLTPVSQSGAVTFSYFLDEFQRKLRPQLATLAIVPNLTNTVLSGAEEKALDDLARDLPQTQIWRDDFIPRISTLASGDVPLTGNASARLKFASLAAKISSQLNLGKHEPNASKGAYSNARRNRESLPQ